MIAGSYSPQDQLPENLIKMKNRITQVIATLLPGRSVAASFAVVSLLAVQAQAAILASYEFTGLSYSATTTAPDLNAGDLEIGALGDEFGVYGTDHGISSGTTMPSTPPASPSVPTHYITGVVTTTTQVAAITANDYVSFGISPASGFKINLQSFTVDFTVNGNTSGTNTGSIFLRSSVDGFASDVGNIGALTYFGNNLANNPYNRHTVDLSTFADVEGAITFRLYVYQTGKGGNVTRFDNLTLNGDVTAVPEPSTGAVAAFGMLLLLNRRRRV